MSSTLARKLDELGVRPQDVLRHAGLRIALFDQEEDADEQAYAR